MAELRWCNAMVECKSLLTICLFAYRIIITKIGNLHLYISKIRILIDIKFRCLESHFRSGRRMHNASKTRKYRINRKIGNSTKIGPNSRVEGQNVIRLPNLRIIRDLYKICALKSSVRIKVVF